jgi:hypothetical protein
MSRIGKGRQRKGEYLMHVNGRNELLQGLESYSKQLYSGVNQLCVHFWDELICGE